MAKERCEHDAGTLAMENAVNLAVAIEEAGGSVSSIMGKYDEMTISDFIVLCAKNRIRLEATHMKKKQDD